MDFSFVYFSVVLGSLWRVIGTVFVDNLGAERGAETLDMTEVVDKWGWI